MGAPVIPISVARSNGHQVRRERTVLAEWDDGPALAAVHQGWDVSLTATLRDDAAEADDATRVIVSWVFHTNHLARSYVLDIYSEGWDRHTQLRGAYRPEDTAVQRARHDAIFTFVSELMAASYGVPA